MMHCEEEIKLTASSSATLDAVALDPAILACAQGRVMRSRQALTTYHDTPDHLLLRHRLAFRLRQRDSGEVIVALKGMGSMLDGVARRNEWEMGLTEPLHQLGDLPPSTLRDHILSICAPDTVLQPLLETHFQQRILVLQIGESLVEMALDQGEVRAGGAVHPLCEVELEVLEGELSSVQGFASQLSKRHALHPSQQSKFGLGLSLLGLQKDV